MNTHEARKLWKTYSLSVSQWWEVHFCEGPEDWIYEGRKHSILSVLLYQMDIFCKGSGAWTHEASKLSSPLVVLDENDFLRKSWSNKIWMEETFNCSGGSWWGRHFCEWLEAWNYEGRKHSIPSLVLDENVIFAKDRKHEIIKGGNIQLL